jgi:predicted unusual protein kinase regulating ubiquinone biosynthesis (AarF/ABC1/UbiB family)
MSDISRSGIQRGVRLARLPVAHAGRVALGLGRRFVGRPAELVAAEIQARSADQLFQVLGELKGGAMKVGQAMAAMEAAMPVELARPYREALTQLVESVPALPPSVVHETLASAWGPDWRDRFRTFADLPAAAASLGQVHRATWADGTDVAVKVQYPGVADAIAADLRQLGRLRPLVRLGAPGVDPEALFAELGSRLLEELDYHREAANQRAFAEGFSGDDGFVVPSVVEVADGVLVSEWVEATPLVELIDRGRREHRDRAGAMLVRLLVSGPARAGRIHGDPHPGNFRLGSDGRLVVLDFGSCEPVPGRWPRALGQLLRAGRDRDADTLHTLAVAAGLLAPDDLRPEELCDLLDPWFEPLRVDRFHFERSWLNDKARQWSRPGGPTTRLRRRVRLPARHLLVQRVGFGLLGVLASLDATVAVAHEAEGWVPGLA